MDKVTQSPEHPRLAARRRRSAAPAVSPRLIEEAARVFLALGITSADLRLRARRGTALAELVDAMDTATAGAK